MNSQRMFSKWITLLSIVTLLLAAISAMTGSGVQMPSASHNLSSVGTVGVHSGWQISAPVFSAGSLIFSLIRYFGSAASCILRSAPSGYLTCALTAGE